MKRAIFALALLLASCANKSANPKVRIAMLGTGLQAIHLPIALAETLGYFQAEGLDVTLDNFSSNLKTVQAVIGGSVDVAGIHHMQTFQMAAEGQILRSFFLLSHRSSAILVVSPAAEQKIRRLEDLKGAIIGVPSPGAANHMIMNYFLQSHGVPTAELTTVAIGVAASALAAVESGRVDAAVLANGDHFRLLERHPNLRILMDSSTLEGMRAVYGSDTLPIGALAAKPAWLAQNPDSARRLTRALARANQWIATHSAEEIREKLPPGWRSPDPAADLTILRWSIPTFTPDGGMPPRALNAQKRMLDATADNIRNAKIDPNSTWTSDFLPNSK